MVAITDQNEPWWPYAGPGGWNGENRSLKRPFVCFHVTFGGALIGCYIGPELLASAILSCLVVRARKKREVCFAVLGQVDACCCQLLAIGL